MANEIRTLLNSVSGVKADWVQDWKEDANGKWLADWSNDNFVVGTPSYVGTGNGTCTAVSVNGRSARVETWTITATSATNFTVSGSVSGAKAAATVGTAYNNGTIAFTLTAGGTAFTAGGVWTIAVTDGNPVNTVLPVLSTGSPVSGTPLTVTSGTWTGAATISYTYQWYRGTTKIADRKSVV